MKKLPKGYYAVLPPDAAEGAESIFFRGEEFAAEPGVNLFFSPAEAAAAATEIPDEIIAGLPYDSFCAPVVIFSEGEHKIDGTNLTRPVVLLGTKAGIDPNLPAPHGEAPGLNPERGDGESVLTGSFYRGVCTLSGDEMTYLLVDGFSCAQARFTDGRNNGGEAFLSFRNMIHLSHCGKNLFAFGSPSAEGGIRRRIEMINQRLSDFDDLDYGGMFMRVCPSKLTVKGLVYEKTCQLFGFSDLPRELPGCPANEELAEYEITDSYFGELSGDREFCTGSLPADRAVSVTVSRCTFADASMQGRPPVSVYVSPRSRLTINDCVFSDSRDNPGPAVLLTGEGGEVDIVGCEFSGFASETERELPAGTSAPSVIRLRPGKSGTDDPHTVLDPGEADFSALDSQYAGKTVSWGDLHVHTACGGTSDGKTPMKDFPAAMDALGVDFCAVVDHRQMRGFFLPEWDEKRFIIGTEPGTRITDLNSCRHGMSGVHYNMLFPHKYSLALVLANFPEFEFRGDELTGSFKYPKFTKERFAELTAFVRSIGGIMVHPHPKTMLSSDDPTDYSFGDGTFLETIYVTPSSHASFKNYRLWTELLGLGIHVYASGGSDTHGAVSNKAVAAFYTAEKSGEAFFGTMRSGDFTVGNYGIQMTLGGLPAGSETVGGAGETLLVRVPDVFPPSVRAGTAYELRVYTDKGLAFSGSFDGTPGQSVALVTEERKFYRAEVYDATHGYPVAICNPVWTDGKITK